MLIDLQLHSTYSDGYLTPTELAALIKKQGVRAASLTDHNTVAGLAEFRNACSRLKIKAIPGIELYASLGSKKFNIIWYNCNEDSPELHDFLRASQVRRRRQARNILTKLARRGFKIDPAKVLDKYNHYVPVNHLVDELAQRNRPRIARELKDKNFSEGDVISKYFRNKQIGVLNESFVSLKRVMELKKKVGGQVILNHPGKYGNTNKQLWLNLEKAGVIGAELLSPHHTYGAIMVIQKLARELKWITTGGSDFHRFEGGGFPVQSSSDYFEIDTKYLTGIQKIIGKV